MLQNKILIFLTAILITFSATKLLCQEDGKEMAVVICSYNNEQWVEKNLKSIYAQKYENYSVIYVNDCSSDKTLEKVYEIIEECGQQERTTVINNEKRCGAMANWYTTIHTVPDDVIVVQVDGDDFLAHENVLAYLNKIYANPSIWMTYGQFIEYPANTLQPEYSKPFSKDIIQRNAFRSVGQLPISHLRTSYAWLFKAIKLEDVLYQGEYYPMTCDKVMLACMIEMAAYHHYCVPVGLYLYNTGNQLSDHRVNQKMQHTLAWHILRQPAYPQLTEPVSVEPDGTEKVSLIYIAHETDNIEKSIEEILAKIDPIHSIYVIIPPEKMTSSSLPGEIKSVNVHTLVYNNQSVPIALQKISKNSPDEYFLLTDSSDADILQNTDLNICIRFMKKTQCELFLINPEEIAQAEKLPCVSHEYQIYAMPKNSEISNKNHALLFHKKLLLKAIENINVKNIECNIQTIKLTKLISKAE